MPQNFRKLISLTETMNREFVNIAENYQYELFDQAKLYHTTSPAAAFDILKSGELRPKQSDGFVSLSEKPHLHDIEAHGAVIVFDRGMLYSQLIKVDYSERWAKKHQRQASYIAGEGWSDQFEYSPDDDDEFDDGYDDAYADGEMEAFLVKSDEDEWISSQPGQAVRFTKDAVVGLILDDVVDAEEDLAAIGYEGLRVSRS